MFNFKGVVRFREDPPLTGLKGCLTNILVPDITAHLQRSKGFDGVGNGCSAEKELKIITLVLTLSLENVH